MAVISTGNNGNHTCDFSYCKSDGGIDQIIICGNNKDGVFHTEAKIGVSIIRLPHNHPISTVVQLNCLLRVIGQQDIFQLSSVQLDNEFFCDRIEVCYDNVPRCLFRQFSWSKTVGLCLKPGGIKKLNKGKRQHNEQQHHSGNQYQKSKKQAKIC